MLTTASNYVPGIYPYIRKLKPKIGGKNNLGVGVDTEGREYVLKRGRLLCVAEFVGASLCGAIGAPCCSPAIVSMRNMAGGIEYLYGSVIEDGLLSFDRTSIKAWGAVVPTLANASIFSTMLAVDLAIGNDDRHADNWLVKINGTTPTMSTRLVSIDFSNSWPVCQPPHHPRRQPSINTMHIVKHWHLMGITFEHDQFRKACAKMGGLNETWLLSILDPMVGIWLTEMERDELGAWWRGHWKSQAIDTIYSLESDGDWQ